MLEKSKIKNKTHERHSHASSKSFLSELADEVVWKPAIQQLKEYLDQICFHGLYKYMVTPSPYFLTPSAFNYTNTTVLKSFSQHINAQEQNWKLAECLTTNIPCHINSLNAKEQETAKALTQSGLMFMYEDCFFPASIQLISVHDCYVLVDSAIHFKSDRMHEIYIGIDTYMLMYYMSDLSAKQFSSSLDLCSGSGVLGLVMSKFSQHVLSTDIARAPLALIPINTVLNAAEERIEIRKEDIQTTLAGSEKFDVITCNPPFVALPPDFEGPIYAAGLETDGLGYLRLLFDNVPGKLKEGGVALFVADLPGNSRQPHFFKELRKFAKKHSLRVDAYIDNKLDWKPQADCMTNFIARLHPDSEIADIRKKTEHFITQDLQASHYYLTTFRIKKEKDSGLRVFDRTRIWGFDDFFE